MTGRCAMPNCAQPASWSSVCDLIELPMCTGHARVIRARLARAGDTEVVLPDGSRCRLADILGAAEEPQPIDGAPVTGPTGHEGGVALVGRAATPRPPTRGEINGAAYTSPILDAIADRAIRHLGDSPDPLTVRDLAERIGANPSTLGNVLRGASTAYGSAPFERFGGSRRAWLWALSASWTERYR